jgi:3-oxoacyl-[acyl-carrier protein] reductase
MPECQYDFNGRSVIVTGAGRGIGLAVAQAFAAARAAVTMVDLDADVLAEEAGAIGALGVVADISKTEQVQRVVDETVAATGRVDVVVNNAGILRDKMLWKLTDDDFDSVVAVHLGGTFRMTRACVPHFRAQQYGRIVNVTSYTGLHGNIGQAAYSSAKAGIIGLTKTTAKELAPFGVTANAIAPSARTRMIESMPEERQAQAEASIPLRRFGDPSEIAGAVMYLASDGAGYATGTVLEIDGGVSM